MWTPETGSEDSEEERKQDIRDMEINRGRETARKRRGEREREMERDGDGETERQRQWGQTVER